MKSSEERNENKGNSKEEKCSSTVDFLSYKPSKSNYDPIKDAAWQKGEKVPYLALAKTFQEIETVSSRLKMIEILGNYLWSVKMLSPSDLLPSIYLALNKLGPDYEGVELGIGDSLIIKALAEATGRKADQIKNEIEKKGDLGLVAESSRGNQKVMFQPPKLILSSVFAKLKEIATMSGQSSMSKKVEKVKALLVACRDCEARYLVRSLTGKLRIGLAEQSLLVSLARCILLSEDPKLLRNTESFKKKLESATQIIKTTYCECPNYDKIVDVLLQHGIEELPNHCHLTPGIPLKPMLAHPTKGVSEILKRFENSKFTCEYKYDGERAQIHLVEKEKIFIFSRNQENNTSKYPELLSRLTQAAKENVVNYILDCEAVAWDKEKKQILPFQVLSTRKRKDAKEDEIKVKVCLFAFDLLFFNGKSLVTEPLRSRRDILRRSFKEIEGEFMFAASKDFDSIEEVQEFLDESIRNKCEGLMVKSLDNEATYEIAKRSHSWLKLKKDYLDGVGDTIDTVVIGGYYGKGKRTGNFGGYLLATYDPESEEFQAICKIGTGFKDEDLEKHSQFFRNHIISDPKSYYSVDESIKPDVWFDAVQVWEVKCADLSVSPIYRAAYGMIEEDKGISLRFPRFIRIREDKKPEDATDAQEIAELYSNQEIVKQQQNNDNEN
ncbi:DNA ligase 1-like isoform X2 [Dinothrombium tinctorium]|uniref:DNA ligase n=1 Tax=Dinothrombium tinctorium TaxID=1965070 RepID=A0A443QWN8_9ACAR|nr:DNA ligase 1-like isoform X2 [Dinothrombium tinctorium]